MSGIRTALVAVVTALVVGLGAGPALAGAPASVAPASAIPTAVEPAPTDGCAQVAEGYAAPAACQLLVARAAGVCVSDTPVLDYAVVPEGTPNQTVTITWVNPDGADVVQSGLPLTGQVLWPGAVVENGVAVGWPGRVQAADGSWAEGGPYLWARSAVQILFEVNPSATTTVSYPAATAACAGPVMSQVLAVDDPATPTSAVLGTGFASAVLAATGRQAEQALAIGGLLLGTGVLLVVLAARRRRHHRLA
jgi:hypothetical protein